MPFFRKMQMHLAKSGMAKHISYDSPYLLVLGGLTLVAVQVKNI